MAAHEAEPPLRDLCLQYKTILENMHAYEELHGHYPNADSPEFYQFLREKALPIVDMSQERLTLAIHFLERSYRESVRDRGVNAVFSMYYLDYRFQLSVPIWGEDQLGQMLFDDPEAGGLGNINAQNVVNIQIVVNEEEQHARDVAILRALIQFKDADGGIIPGADSVDFYEFAAGLPSLNPLRNIEQDMLVERILMLQENFIRAQANVQINNNEMEEEIADPRRLELYDLSRQIWVEHQQGFGAAADEQLGDQIGQDLGQGAGVENAAGGDDHEDGGVEEDDLGCVEDD